MHPQRHSLFSSIGIMPKLLSPFKCSSHNDSGMPPGHRMVLASPLTLPSSFLPSGTNLPYATFKPLNISLNLSVTMSLNEKGGRSRPVFSSKILQSMPAHLLHERPLSGLLPQQTFLPLHKWTHL